MSQILIGYVLVFFHITINGFDLLPDFIGYALIFIGLGRLAAESENFAKARPWALGMSLWCAVAVLLPPVGIMQSDGMGVAWVALSCLVVCVALYLQYHIVCGVCDLERLVGRELGGLRLLQVWKVVALLETTALVLLRVPHDVSVVLGGLLVVAAFVAQMFFLVYFYKAKDLYAAARS